jgi:microcystin-dependent protein
MPSVFTPNINLEEPGLGDYVNNWQTPLNSNFTIADACFGSSTTVPLSSSNVTLSVAQSAFFQIICTGVLTANVQLILPATIGGRRVIFNQCTGAFQIAVLNGAGDSGGGVVVGQGFQTPVVLTAGRAYVDAYASTPPGTILSTSFNNALPGFLYCFGQNVSRTIYAQLWTAAQAYGWPWGNGDGSTTFTIPDLRGRLLAGADNMGGSAANRLSGYVVGSTGGEQTHLLVTGEMPTHSHVDSGHGHSLADPGHVHTISNIQGVNASGTTEPYLRSQAGGGLTTDSSTTGITIATGNANIQNTGGGLAHNNVQPTAAINYVIRY